MSKIPQQMQCDHCDRIRAMDEKPWPYVVFLVEEMFIRHEAIPLELDFCSDRCLTQWAIDYAERNAEKAQ